MATAHRHLDEIREFETEELPEILTVDELARLLRLNRKTVYEAIAAGENPGVRKIGRSYRISRTKVLAWLAEGHGHVSPKRRRK